MQHLPHFAIRTTPFYTGGVIGLIVSDFKQADRSSIIHFLKSYGDCEICDTPPWPEDMLGVYYQQREIPALVLTAHHEKK
jgi:hypothetical protein